MTRHTRGLLTLAVTGLLAGGLHAQVPDYDGVAGGIVNLPPETHAEEYDRQLAEREQRRDTLDEAEQKIQDELDAALAEMDKVAGLRRYLYGHASQVVRNLRGSIRSSNEYVASTSAAIYVGYADALAQAISTNDVPGKIRVLRRVRAQLVRTKATLEARSAKLDEEYTQLVGLSDAVGDLTRLRLPRTPELGNVWRNIGDQRWAAARANEVESSIQVIDATIGMHGGIARAEKHLRAFDAPGAMGVLSPWMYQEDVGSQPMP